VAAALEHAAAVGIVPWWWRGAAIAIPTPATTTTGIAINTTPSLRVRHPRSSLRA
jgi:hypothetical protein